MIRLVINGKDAVLHEDTEIVLKLNNRIIASGKGDATYPFTLPLQANRHIFGWIDRINTNVSDIAFPAEVYCGPFCLIEGQVTVTGFSSEGVEVYVAEGQRSFWAKIDSFVLSDLSIKGEESGGSNLPAFSQSLYNRYKYVACPLKDPTMTAIPDSHDGDKKHFDIQPEIINPLFWDEGKVPVFIPFLRFSVVLEAIITGFGYTIGKNALSSIPDFDNMLIVNRRLFYHEYDGRKGLSHLGNYLPEISYREFLDEIERKFAVVFFVRENAKTIDIISFNDFLGDKEYTIDIYNEFSREMLSPNDIVTGYKFSDKPQGDKSMVINENEYKALSENVETIECISLPLKLEGQVGYQMAVIDVGSTATVEEKDATRDKEFRLAIYYPNRCMMGEKGESGFSLLWKNSNDEKIKGLFESRYRKLADYKMGLRETVSLEIFRPQLTMLQNIQQIFGSYVNARNNRYIIEEQEISITMQGIGSWQLRGHPF